MAQLKDLIVNGVGRFIGKVYASEFVGKLTGNADTATSATKATQDESGNNIKSSYASSIGISDHTITLKNKNGESLETVTVPDNNTWRPLGTGANDACAGNDSRLSNARPANGSGYVSELVGVQSNNTPYSHVEGNIIRAVWNTKSDNRWYLKAGDYGCRVSCADSADSANNSTTVNGHTVNADVPSGAKFTDTVYTHPTTSGNKHIPSGGSSGQILKWSADGTAVWGVENSSKTPSIDEIGSSDLNTGCYVYPMKELHIIKYLNATKTITITQYVSRGYSSDVYYNYVKLRLNLYGYGMYEGELMCVMGGSDRGGVTGKLGGTLNSAAQYGTYFTWSSTSLSASVAGSGGYITHTIKVTGNSPIDIIYSGDSTVSVKLS